METIFSPCRTWRYTLYRRWWAEQSPRFMNFILLNPSTADEERDDPTIRRCIGFARRENLGAMVTTNIFAFRATDPKVMKSAPDPIGPDNDEIILDIASRATVIVLGWGNHGAFRDRGIDVLRLLQPFGRRLHVLGWTRAMQPKHPLYLPSTAKLLEVKTERSEA